MWSQRLIKLFKGHKETVLLMEHNAFITMMTRYYQKLDTDNKHPLIVNRYVLEAQLMLLKQNHLKDDLLGALFIATGNYLTNFKIATTFRRQLCLSHLMVELFKRRHELTSKTQGALIIELSRLEGIQLNHKETEALKTVYSKLIS